MNNQKKIEEILYSIQELILEAQNEKKLDLVETKQVIELDKINPSKTDNLENNQDYTESYVNKLIKTKEFKNTKLERELTKNNYNLKSSWKDLSFKKCQQKASNSSIIETNKNNFENDLEKMFRDSLSFWIKKNLPDLIKDETALHTKKIFEDKLK
tara:strand:+ start:811 stop:1278 length:468 start_codon:yes stop_codon:yes gene_type:complete